MFGVRALGFVLCLTYACAPTQSVSVKTRVGVTITPAPRDLPFNPREARLVSAHDQLARIAGHPITLALDAAVSPESRTSFEEALIDAFTSIARDLDELRQRNAAALAFGVSLFDRVEILYDGTKRRDDIALDENSRAIVIRGPAERRALVPNGIVFDTLLRAYDQHQSTRFEHQSPDSIPPTEHEEYFRWLTNSDFIRRPRAASRPDPAAPPEAMQTLNVLRLFELNRNRNADLIKKTRAWLLARGSYFVQRYVHDANTVLQLPASCTFNQAARAWTAWATATYPTLDDEARLRLAKEFFVRSFQSDRARTQRAYPPFAWPGADLFELGLGEIDRWRQSGHPTQLSKPRVGSATDFIVCTRVFDQKSGASVAPNCQEDWYRFALEATLTRKRFVRAIVERHDPIFTETAFKNVRAASERPLDMLLVLLREFEADEPSWAIGWRILANEYVESSFDSAVLEETRRLWVTYPHRRGILLSGLAHMDRGGRGNVDWRGFADAFGGPIAPEEFTAYVTSDPSALFDISLVWPALGRGWSRAALIVPEIDTWLTRSNERRFAYQNPYQSLQHIIGEMCREKGVKDLGLMRNYLEDRKRRRPGEPYVSLIASTEQRQCQPPPPPPPPRNEVKLSPLRLGLPPLRIIQTGAE